MCYICRGPSRFAPIATPPASPLSSPQANASKEAEERERHLEKGEKRRLRQLESDQLEKEEKRRLRQLESDRLAEELAEERRLREVERSRERAAAERPAEDFSRAFDCDHAGAESPSLIKLRQLGQKFRKTNLVAGNGYPDRSQQGDGGGHHRSKANATARNAPAQMKGGDSD